MTDQTDDRIIPIRCLGCHRLRPYPTTVSDAPCGCGAIVFESSWPHPDEEDLCVKIYTPQIEERNLWKHLF